MELKATFRNHVPLPVRKGLVLGLEHVPLVPYSYSRPISLLEDLAEQTPTEFHRFLWAHHLAYAETYTVGQRFGGDQLQPTRLMLTDMILETLAGLGLDPASDVNSVFDVGCSLGYLLRYFETDVF